MPNPKELHLQIGKTKDGRKELTIDPLGFSEKPLRALLIHEINSDKPRDFLLQPRFGEPIGFLIPSGQIQQVKSLSAADQKKFINTTVAAIIDCEWIAMQEPKIDER